MFFISVSVPKTFGIFKQRANILCYVNEVTFRKTSENERAGCHGANQVFRVRLSVYPIASGRERRGMEVESVTNGQFPLKSYLRPLKPSIKPKRTHFSDLCNYSENMEVWASGTLGEIIEV